MKEKSEQDAYLQLAALCAQAEHCQQEMRDKMKRWDIDAATQDRIVARLIKERYVDDERYARAFVHDKMQYNQWGRRKIEQALWLKHIDEHTVRRVLDEIDDAEYAAILKPMLKQKRRHTTAGSDYELNMKLMKWAMGRGFTMDVIRQCLDVSDEDEFLD